MRAWEPSFKTSASTSGFTTVSATSRACEIASDLEAATSNACERLSNASVKSRGDSDNALVADRCAAGTDATVRSGERKLISFGLKADANVNEDVPSLVMAAAPARIAVAQREAIIVAVFCVIVFFKNGDYVSALIVMNTMAAVF